MKKITSDFVGTVANVKIELPFEVNVLESVTGNIYAEIHGDKKAADKIVVATFGNKVKFYYLSQSSGNINTSGNITIIGDNNIVVSGSGAVDSDIDKIEKIDIFIPKDSKLKASDFQKLIVKVDLSALKINASGKSVALIENVLGGKTTINLSGRSECEVKNIIGNLTLGLSGASSIKISGSFDNIRVDASGNSRIDSEGNVSGDYTADMSGNSYCGHTGEINGNCKSDCSGNSKFHANK